MEYYICKPDSELYHWGVKGMRWGVRRYQNKDGSLTKAGKKRRAKLEGELEKLGGGKKSDGDGAPQKKSISEMSTAELKEAKARMDAEKDYYTAQQSLAAVKPRHVSKGQKFAEDLYTNVLKPVGTNVGKAYLEKMLKEKIGIKDETKINWDDMIKKQTYEKNERDKVYQDLKRENDINQEKDRAEARNEKRAETKKKATSDDSSNASNSNAGNAKKNKTDSKVYEGTVEGTGTSKKNNSDSKGSSKKGTVIDAEWYEVPVSDVSTSMTSRGQSYIAGLLNPPKERDDD